MQKKVKLQFADTSYPKVIISPAQFLNLYVGGINDFSFISDVIKIFAQRKNETVESVNISGACLTFKKNGMSINLISTTAVKTNVGIVSKLILTLTKVLTQQKTAVDISTIQ